MRIAYILYTYRAIASGRFQSSSCLRGTGNDGGDWTTLLSKYFGYGLASRPRPLISAASELV